MTTRYVFRCDAAVPPLGVANTEALTLRGVTGVNVLIRMSSELLERLAEAVVSGRIVMPPVTRIKLGDVPGLNGMPNVGGKTVIIL